MKKSLLLLVAIIATVFSSNAQYHGNSNGNSSYGSSSYGVNTNSTYVNGYTKSNGTYVQGHYRSSQNTTNHDNYSTSGNYNPYTGTQEAELWIIRQEHTIMVPDIQYTQDRAVDSIT